MSSQLLIVTDGLISYEEGYITHPLLDPWHKQLLRCSRSWFDCIIKTDIEWQASLLEEPPTALLAAAFSDRLTESAQQLWIASPYHAQLGRDRIRVMPDSIFPWREEDAIWICDLLNPLLKEEGIELLHHKSALLLTCNTPMNTTPDSFAMVAGKLLPNRHPDGVDGGRLMRLMAEIQMVLSLKPAEHRRLSGEPDVHGLWLWGGHAVSDETAKNKTLSVATRNPLLMSIVDGKDASVIISSAEQLGELTQVNMPLPKQVVLAGDSEAVVLKSSLIPRIGRAQWRSKSAGSEERLMNMLRSLL